MNEKVSRLLSFSREQVFDLLADIERYPEFLRGWSSARITQRTADRLVVDQVVGFGPARLRFTTVATLDRPERLEVISADRAFRAFRLVFEVTPEGVQGCRIRVSAHIEPRSLVVRQIVKGVLDASLQEIIAAFEMRAQGLFGYRHD